MSLPDLWDNCYDGKARSLLSPEAFRNEYCRKCINFGCRNARGEDRGLTLWDKRMSTQADRLLHNPNFGNPQDPAYRNVVQAQFQDIVQKALAIEVAERKGDWSIPTPEEVGTEAASLIGLTPSGFRSTPEPDDVKPPERLVDEVKVSKFERMQELQQLPPPPEPEGLWRVQGSKKGTFYEVSQFPGDVWRCTCPSREDPCKHIQHIQKRVRRLPVPEAPKKVEPPRLPPPASAAPVWAPGQGLKNTSEPSQGIMVGGGKPSPSEDPWAPTPTPKVRERKISVGGRIRFKKSSGPKNR